MPVNTFSTIAVQEPPRRVALVVGAECRMSSVMARSSDSLSLSPATRAPKPCCAVLRAVRRVGPQAVSGWPQGRAAPSLRSSVTVSGSMRSFSRCLPMSARRARILACGSVPSAAKSRRFSSLASRLMRLVFELFAEQPLRCFGACDRGLYGVTVGAMQGGDIRCDRIRFTQRDSQILT